MRNIYEERNSMRFDYYRILPFLIATFTEL